MFRDRRSLQASLKIPIARIRAGFARLAVEGRLAPGRLDANETGNSADPAYLSEMHRRHGDVFKVWENGKLTTCIVGIDRAARFLADNRENLVAATIDLRHVFPHGFLRGMEGETHRKYRRLLSAALQSVTLEDHRSAIDGIIAQQLDRLAENGEIAGTSLARTMKSITTSIMLRLLLGYEENTPEADAVAAAYNAYAWDGMPIVVRDNETAAFARIRELLSYRLQLSGSNESSAMGWILDNGHVDPTLIGNVLQLVEVTRHDMHGLYRWIFDRMADVPEFADEVRFAASARPRARLTGSAVRETLRLHQSEYIYRIVRKSFSYSGYLFPRRSRVRICIRESHGDPVSFENPQEFDPRRFVETEPVASDYAPLGIDHHRCIGNRWTIWLGERLIDVLASRYRLSRVGAGDIAIDNFHFAPAKTNGYRFERLP